MHQWAWDGCSESPSGSLRVVSAGGLMQSWWLWLCWVYWFSQSQQHHQTPELCGSWETSHVASRRAQLSFLFRKTKISSSTDTGTYRAHPHQLTPAELQNCYSHVKNEKLGISADLTLLQLSLSSLIILAAGAARRTGRWVWEVGCWVFLSPYMLQFLNDFVALKLHEICF